MLSNSGFRFRKSLINQAGQQEEKLSKAKLNEQGSKDTVYIV